MVRAPEVRSIKFQFQFQVVKVKYDPQTGRWVRFSPLARLFGLESGHVILHSAKSSDSKFQVRRSKFPRKLPGCGPHWTSLAVTLVSRCPYQASGLRGGHTAWGDQRVRLGHVTWVLCHLSVAISVLHMARVHLNDRLCRNAHVRARPWASFSPLVNEGGGKDCSDGHALSTCSR